MAVSWLALNTCAAVRGEKQTDNQKGEDDIAKNILTDHLGAATVCSNDETVLEVTATNRTVRFKCPKDAPIIRPSDVSTVLEERGDGSCSEEELAVSELAPGAQRSLTAEANPKTNTLSFPELPEQSFNLCLVCTSSNQKGYQKSCKFIVKVQAKSAEDPDISTDLHETDQEPHKQEESDEDAASAGTNTATTITEDRSTETASQMHDRTRAGSSPTPSKRGSRCFRVNVVTREGQEVPCP